MSGRLEEIKGNWEYGKCIKPEDVEALIERVGELENELFQWETGQNQTVQHYDAYRNRGVEIYGQEQYIKELEKQNRFLNKAHKTNLKIAEYAQQENKRLKAKIEQLKLQIGREMD